MVSRDTDTSGTGLTASGDGYARLWPVADANFNTVALVAMSDDAATVVERYSYDPFGTVTYMNGSYTVEGGSSFAWVYLFQGGRLDTITGDTHFGARNLDSELGTWTSEDPLRFKAGDTNLYTFVFNSPVGLDDPSGQILPALLFWGGVALFGLGCVTCGGHDSNQSANGQNGVNLIGAGLALPVGVKVVRVGLRPILRGGVAGSPPANPGNSFPANAQVGQTLTNINPNTLQAGRGDLAAGRLTVQQQLIQQGTPRATPIKVTTDGVIWDGNHGATAAAQAGRPVTVEVIQVPPGMPPPVGMGPVTNLPIRPGN